MKIKPLYDRVLILPEQKQTSNSGILIPQTAQEQPQIGKVIEVGDGESPDMDKTGMKVKVGDVVMFNKFAGNEIKIEGKTYMLIRQVDLIGVIYE